jgi:biotin operon repressor
MPDELLTILKLLADETRLNIIGLLAQEARSVDELAAILNLGASTVSHHLTRLRQAGLVAATAHQYYSIYALDPEVLRGYVARLTPEYLARRAQASGAVDSAAYTRQILARWAPQERLQGLPGQIQHRQVVLAWLVDKFERDKRYDHDQAWRLLDRWCGAIDATELTRTLVEAQLLARTPDGHWYWRVDSPTVRAGAEFTPELLPQADIARPDPWERWRDGRLLVSDDPQRQRLNLIALALRFKSGQTYSQAEVEAILRQYSEGDPTALREAMLHEQLIRQHDDGTYWRKHVTP